jgi:hypothetical protein
MPIMTTTGLPVAEGQAAACQQAADHRAFSPSSVLFGRLHLAI